MTKQGQCGPPGRGGRERGGRGGGGFGWRAEGGKLVESVRGYVLFCFVFFSPPLLLFCAARRLRVLSRALTCGRPAEGRGAEAGGRVLEFGPLTTETDHRILQKHLFVRRPVYHVFTPPPPPPPLLSARPSTSPCFHFPLRASLGRRRTSERMTSSNKSRSGIKRKHSNPLSLWLAG